MSVEILFIVEDATEGGYVARAASASIYTEAGTVPELHQCVREAVRCHFVGSERPRFIRLRYVRDTLIAA